MTDYWRRKIIAYLHDPPDKALCIVGHERRAADYILILLGESISREGIKHEASTADAVSASAERLPFPTHHELKVDFLGEPVGPRTVVHPLSGESRQLAALGREEAREAIEGVLRDVAAKVIADERRLFLALWRLLPEMLARRYGQFAYLPADTRIPDHTIWNHCDVVSALAPCLEASKDVAFLHFSIGPVQPFIASAKTTRDLWTGSFLLSWLSFQAMRVVAERLGPDHLVYPSLRGNPLADWWLRDVGLQEQALKPDWESLLRPCLPNKFLAVVPSSAAEKLAQDCEKAVHEAWGSVSAAGRKLLVRRGVVDDELDGWNEQLRSLLECFWVVVPWRGAEVGSIIEEHRRILPADATVTVDAVRECSPREKAGDKQKEGNVGVCWSLYFQDAALLLGARKRVRDFAAYKGDGRFKDTTDGHFEQMGPRGNLGAAAGFWKRLRKGLSEGKGIVARVGPHERLSAVSLTKRLAWDAFVKRNFDVEEAMPFPSAASLATSVWREEVVNAAAKSARLGAAIEGYCDAAMAFLEQSRQPTPRGRGSEVFGDIDGEWLFEENFSDYRAKKEEWGDEANGYLKEQRQRCKEAIKTLIQAAQDIATVEDTFTIADLPPRYFAVLVLDGDDLGRWLSGLSAPKIRDVLHPKARDYFDEHCRELISKRRPLGPMLHAAISEALANFAVRVAPEIVERKYLGKLVYAGGDDLLALLPVQNVLLCARELRLAYSGDVECNNNAPSGYYNLDGQQLLMMGSKATASAGIAIAHYKDPLHRTLQAAREALNRQAKKSSGKDALAITVLKRSGEQVEVAAKWRLDGLDTAKSLNEICKMFRNGLLSPRFPQQLAMQFASIAIDSEMALPSDALVSEIKRIVKRQSAAASQEGNAELVGGLLARWLHGQASKSKGHAGEPIHPFASFISLIRIAAFMARGGVQ